MIHKQFTSEYTWVDACDAMSRGSITTMTYVVVPLGNEGERYKKTRHNAGRIVCEGMTLPPLTELFIPEGFMNESGQKIREYLRFHDNRTLIVVYDDKDLPLSTIRIAYGRGDGGHNGIKSVIEHIGTPDFIRVRIGIAPSETNGRDVIPPHGKEVQDYVLENFNEEELNSIISSREKVSEIVNIIVTDGYMKAMERYNGA